MVKRFQGHIKNITESIKIASFYMDNEGRWWLLTDDSTENGVPKLRRIYERKGGNEYIVINRKRIYASDLEGKYGNEGQLSFLSEEIQQMIEDEAWGIKTTGAGA